MPVQATVTSNQINASVSETQIDVSVSGGVGPSGQTGPAGTTDYSQLTNVPSTFDPQAHAARHSALGSDPVTVVAAQVSDFAAAVVAAAPPTTNASLLVSGTIADARLSANVVLTTDARLSDSREWSAATVTQADAEAGSSTGRFAFTPVRVFQAIAAWWGGSAAKAKLDGISAGATANATNDQLRDRSTHTGTQTASTISDFASAASAAAPVQQVAGKTGSVSLTKSDVGLSNVDNTSDANKPVSAAQASADSAVASAAAADATAKANAAQAHAIQRGNHTGTQAISTIDGLESALAGKQSSGSYATLVDGKVPSSQLPSYVDDVIEAANIAALPANGEAGKIYVTLDTNKTYRWSGSAYVEISPSPGSTDSVTEGSTNLYYTNTRAAAAAPVQSVAGKTGAVSLAKGDVGLGNVDNTSDASKPISTATQAALDGKAASSHSHEAMDITIDDYDGTYSTGLGDGNLRTFLYNISSQSLTGTGTGTVASRQAGARALLDAAAATHVHAASSITSGTLAIARIPTGTTSTTVSLGNHAHGNITSAGAIGSSSGQIVVTTTDGVLTTTSTISASSVSGLAAVATSGSYSSLSGIPSTFAPSAHTHSASDVTSGTLALARLPVTVESSSALGNSGTATTLSLSSASVQRVTLNGNCTFTMPTAVAGASLTLILTQGGSHTATFTAVKWPAGSAPTITTGANKVDVLTFVSDGTNWYGSAVQDMA